MIRFDQWFLPDGETHLQAWMTQMQQRREPLGRLCYQLHKYEAALRYVPQDRRRVAVDVGAHVGLWSWVMAQDFDDLVAFEPKAEHRRCWTANMVGAPGRHVMLIAALGDHTGRVTMRTNPASSGDTFVDPVSGDAGDATLMTLDEFDYPVVDFLKVDCEGYELFVLRGAEATLRRCRPVVVVEQKPGHGAKYGIGDRDGAAYLRTLGYVERETINGDVILTADA